MAILAIMTPTPLKPHKASSSGADFMHLQFPTLPSTPPASRPTFTQSQSTNTQPSPPSYQPPPHPPAPWLWQCHKCHHTYRLGVTRRCLEDSHYFCSGGTTVNKRNGVVKHQRPCRSEFDYRGNKSWAEWRREKDGSGGAERVELLLSHGTPVNVERKNCWNKCDYPSECRWGSSCGVGSRQDNQNTTSPSTSSLSSSTIAQSPPQSLVLNSTLHERSSSTTDFLSTITTATENRISTSPTKTQTTRPRRISKPPVLSPVDEELSPLRFHFALACDDDDSDDRHVEYQAASSSSSTDGNDDPPAAGAIAALSDITLTLCSALSGNPPLPAAPIPLTILTTPPPAGSFEGMMDVGSSSESDLGSDSSSISGSGFGFHGLGDFEIGFEKVRGLARSVVEGLPVPIPAVERRRRWRGSGRRDSGYVSNSEMEICEGDEDVGQERWSTN
ncbi:MAG: hypothetical protein M1827_004937 [Pycnora praestabilis]|nr:MAG: hypothetical protein M1827_004937 [Pycnora praestabilis]